MEINEIIKLIKEGENERIEFKKGKSKDLIEEIVALANTFGGYLIIGIDDEGNIVGCDAKRVIEYITSSLHYISPIPKIEIEKKKINEKEIVIVKVSKSKELCFYLDSSFVRVGASKKRLNINEIIRRLVNIGKIEWDLLKSNVKIGKANKEYINLYFKRLKEMRNRTVKDKHRYLRSVNAITRDGFLTNAGVLFFLDNPEEFIPSATLRVIHINENQEPYKRIEFKGPIWKIADDVIDYLNNNLKLIEVVIGAKRERILEYPILAIREAIINALVHRNYTYPADVRIFIYPYKLIVRSPGSLVPGVDLNDPEHEPRNKAIAQMMYDMGYIEKYGYGILLMKEQCKKHPGVKLKFGISENKFDVIFEKEEFFLDDVDRKILSLLSSKKRSSEIAKEIKMSKVAVLKRINRLISLGLVKKEGKGAGTYYSKV